MWLTANENVKTLSTVEAEYLADDGHELCHLIRELLERLRLGFVLYVRDGAGLGVGPRSDRVRPRVNHARQQTLLLVVVLLALVRLLLLQRLPHSRPHLRAQQVAEKSVNDPKCTYLSSAIQTGAKKLQTGAHNQLRGAPTVDTW